MLPMISRSSLDVRRAIDVPFQSSVAPCGLVPLRVASHHFPCVVLAKHALHCVCDASHSHGAFVMVCHR